MHFIAICVGIIALAALPEAVRIGWRIICALLEVIGYILLAAGMISAIVWIL